MPLFLTWAVLTFSNLHYYCRYQCDTRIMCSLSKEQSILSRETIQNAFFFFFRIMPAFLTWACYPPSSTPQLSVSTCSCLLEASATKYCQLMYYSCFIATKDHMWPLGCNGIHVSLPNPFPNSKFRHFQTQRLCEQKFQIR